MGEVSPNSFVVTNIEDQVCHKINAKEITTARNEVMNNLKKALQLKLNSSNKEEIEFILLNSKILEP